jgi:hypothetical protein
MVEPRKYQLSVLVKRSLRARLGTFEIAITSLKEMIWIAVTIMMM